MQDSLFETPEQLFEGLKSFSRDVDIALEEEAQAFAAERERGLV